ncbi:hypothetical protein LX16_1356 [Stackebrandtia albiflava]|uniref:Methionine/alanine importer small subunit n=1 Tax=Stackebrandtia albiflava TaxID=406432 RepID=A0A562VCQ9_9ACTN|nr:MetS family NSS transporter small subunit [Stackebrandtia albiflava]TWJ15645.1 hypothetical protein LX16_1356 [Stackebrandtia albiflava]
MSIGGVTMLVISILVMWGGLAVTVVVLARHRERREMPVTGPGRESRPGAGPDVRRHAAPPRWRD